MPDDPWDFSIEKVDLGNIQIDPSNPLGMVIAQPLFDLDADSTPPFRIAGEHRLAQIEAIRKAFLVRKVEQENIDKPIPFIVFPEYAIPTGEQNGLAVIREEMEQARGTLVFIGGLESVTRAELEGIVDLHAPMDERTHPHCRGGDFVNVCVIVTRNSEDLAYSLMKLIVA